MQKFAAFAALVADGDLDIGKVTEEKDRLWALRKDEVGALAGAFDKMILSTTDQAQKAKAIAQGDLTTSITIRSEFDVMGKALAKLVEEFHGNSLHPPRSAASNSASVPLYAIRDGGLTGGIS